MLSRTILISQPIGSEKQRSKKVYTWTGIMCAFIRKKKKERKSQEHSISVWIMSLVYVKVTDNTAKVTSISIWNSEVYPSRIAMPTLRTIMFTHTSEQPGVCPWSLTSQRRHEKWHVQVLAAAIPAGLRGLDQPAVEHNSCKAAILTTCSGLGQSFNEQYRAASFLRTP